MAKRARVPRNNPRFCRIYFDGIDAVLAATTTAIVLDRRAREVLDRCLDVSRYLLEQATDWLG